MQALRTTREIVESCFATTLDVDDVGADDNFFEIGGNSMIGVRLVAALRDTELRRVTLREIFDHPTPARLSALLDEELHSGLVDGPGASPAGDRPPILRREPGEPIQLSFAQEGFLMLNQLTGGDSDAYFNQRCAFIVRGVLMLTRWSSR